MYVDLHTHSQCSDGTLTPEELAQAAAAAGVGLFSVTDHNSTLAWPRAGAAAEALEIGYIDGVEIDSVYKGRDLHILAYGCDDATPVFREIVRHARGALDGMSDELVRRMERAGTPARLEEYERWPRDPSLGGWKALYYLAACGACVTWQDAFPLYDRYGVTYAGAGFHDPHTVIQAIHTAGGVAVLAHPGVTFSDAPGEVARTVAELNEMGCDGVECLYPEHDADTARALLEICSERCMYVTAGSDCHGTFSGKPVGYLRTPVEALSLGPIAQKARWARQDAGM